MWLVVWVCHYVAQSQEPAESAGIEVVEEEEEPKAKKMTRKELKKLKKKVTRTHSSIYLFNTLHGMTQ